MTITLITFDGFVKQLDVPEEQAKRYDFRIAYSHSRLNLYRGGSQDALYPPDATFTTRVFEKVRDTYVFQERR